MFNIDIFGWLFSACFPTITTMASNAIDYLIDYNNNNIDNLFSNSAVAAYFAFTLVIGSIMYVIGIGFAFANWAIDTRDGNSNPVLDTLKNILIGLAVLSSYTTIPVLLLKFTNYVCLELCSGLSDYTFSEQMDNFTTGAFDAPNFLSTPQGWFFIYAIIMFVCVVKLFFANIKRGGILMILIFVCSFHLFSIPRGYVDAFWSWCKQVVGICITAFVQNFLIVLSLLVISAGGNSDITSLIVSAGVALSASEAPRILQQFGLDTSMRANVSQAIFAASGITSIVRSFV